MFRPVVLISVPYSALSQVSRDFKSETAGGIVLATGNPYPGRDGDWRSSRALKAPGAGIGCMTEPGGSPLKRSADDAGLRSAN